MQIPASLQPATLDPARTPFVAAALWGGEPASVEHVSTGASFVYRFTVAGRRLYLRLTPPGWQDVAGLRAECSYIEALHAAGIGVARAVPSARGELVEPVIDRGSELLAMVFEAAPGEHVPVSRWDEGRTRRFGRLLGQVHAAAPRSLPPGQTRRGFDDEVALTRRWLPAIEASLHAALDETEGWAATLPRTAEVFGLVHNDLCEDNLLWSESGEPSLIDFDDCTFTWFAADIARTLGSLHDGDPGRYRQLAAWCLEGYRDVRDIDAVTDEFLPRFVKLNAIAGLAWCLHARSRGLYIEDSGEQTEAHLRSVIADPHGWRP